MQNPLSNLNITPTPKVTAVGSVGAVIVLLLQLAQQYWPSFHPPSAATLATIMSAALTVAGWIKRDVSSPNPPPVKLPPATPVGPALSPPAVQVPSGTTSTAAQPVTITAASWEPVNK